MKILNLDAFAPEDRKFILKGIEYSIPGDLPIETWFKLMKHTQDSTSGDVEETKQAFETLADIIKINNPEMTSEKLSQMLSMKQYIELVAHVFRGETEAIQESSAMEEKKTESAGDLNSVP